jgi:arabinogalactan endo-1,4-beta-galactosidase
MPLQPTTPVAGRITRRTLLRATTATAVAFAEETPAEAAASLVKGVGISWAPQMEARGYSWKNAGGQTQDLLTILKGYGITAVRLRTFVNPSGDPANGHCGINEVAAFAKRVKAAGMSIMPVKAVSPNSTVCIHLAQPQKYDVMTTFFSRFAAAGGKWDMSVFSSYGSADPAAGIVGNMRKIFAAYGKPFLQSEFGGRVDRASSTRASLVAYTKALKANGGQGIFYWEPECMSPFTGYTMGAWDSSSKRPTAIMNGFTQA